MPAIIISNWEQLKIPPKELRLVFRPVLAAALSTNREKVRIEFINDGDTGDYGKKLYVFVDINCRNVPENPRDSQKIARDVRDGLNQVFELFYNGQIEFGVKANLSSDVGLSLPEPEDFLPMQSMEEALLESAMTLQERIRNALRDMAICEMLQEKLDPPNQAGEKQRELKEATAYFGVERKSE